MLSMILKMSAVTALYVLLTALIWLRTRGKKLTLARKLAIGMIYGACAVLSTHFGVDYSHMMLNVRDLGPLMAGLYFDPVSGIIADGTKDYAASTGHDLLNQAYGGETKEDGNENILVLCFLDASRFNLDTVQKVGGQAVVETPDHRTFTGRIAKIGNTTPLSRMQAKELLFQNEWPADNCIPGEYSWPVIVKPDEDASAYEFTLAKVTFVTDEIAPIRLLMR